jgi:hypothetical protein
LVASPAAFTNIRPDERHLKKMTYHSSSPCFEPKRIQTDVFTHCVNVTITGFSMFSLVHLTGPLLLEIDYELAVKLRKLAKVVNAWNL